MKITVIKPARRVGAGTALAAVIHAGVDALPIPEGIKVRIKTCGGCARRRAVLDALAPNINPLGAALSKLAPRINTFARNDPPPQPPAT